MSAETTGTAANAPGALASSEAQGGVSFNPATVDPATLTPAMRQYITAKQQHPEYVLFFRMGDFYEMFWDDARLASRVLGLTLSTRSKGGLDAADAVPMAGVPFHAVDAYLRKMIMAGHKVAICEQTEDAAVAKGVIKREVVRLITPGTLTEDPLLEGRSDNFLAAIAPADVLGPSSAKSKTPAKAELGAAWVDLSTGAITVMSGPVRKVLDEITRLAPAEVLVPELASSGSSVNVSQALSGGPKATAAGGGYGKNLHPLSHGLSVNLTGRPGWQFTLRNAADALTAQWGLGGVASSRGFGVDENDACLGALGAVLNYLQETQRTRMQHLRLPRLHLADDFLQIDPASWRALEIEKNVRGGAEGSLLQAIDLTKSAMGSRLLRRWLRYPLRDQAAIIARHDALESLVKNPPALKHASEMSASVCDIERVLARMAVNRAPPRDLAALGKTLADLPRLLTQLKAAGAGDALLQELYQHLDLARDLGGYLKSAILPEPATNLREGGVIAPGYDAELDRLRAIGQSSQQWLLDYQAKLISESAIPNLKVAYNRVFGYYIEVTDTHRAKVPGTWIRRQTVKSAERYITEELRTFEVEALSAGERSISLEQVLFERVRQYLLPHTPQLQELSLALARLDVLGGLAQLAVSRRYVRPVMTGTRHISIKDGRHPVLDIQLQNNFVANDTHFDEQDTVQLITGPNMAGKSTFIRQVALIVLLAQAGSFVPAASASLGVADQLFARIGASDELHQGQSTFMVEMLETANILANASDKSVVVLDEIGRGTSTLDGLSLAWAMVEHMATDTRARTLFATHYHELTDLATRFTGIKNLNVAVREWEDKLIFLHRIVEGAADRSYGIHVARLAGLPPEVLERARQLLGELQVQHVAKPRLSRSKRSGDKAQLQLFATPEASNQPTTSPDLLRMIDDLRKMNPDALTPLAAHELLRRWKQELSS